MDSDLRLILGVVEEAFNIKFRPGELTAESRLSDLCEAVRSRITQQRSHCSFAAVTFWRLRRTCTLLFGVSKLSVSPATKVISVLPVSNRRQQWRALGVTANLRLPVLNYPTDLYTLIMFVGVIVPFLLFETWGFSWTTATICASFWALAIVVVRHLYKPHAYGLSTKRETFGELAKVVAALNYAQLAREFGASTDEELVESLCYLLADYFPVRVQSLLRGDPLLLALIS